MYYFKNAKTGCMISSSFRCCIVLVLSIVALDWVFMLEFSGVFLMENIFCYSHVLLLHISFLSMAITDK